jgi:hypothetical protein
MTMIKQRQKAHMAAQRFQSAGTYCGQMCLCALHTTGVDVWFGMVLHDIGAANGSDLRSFARPRYRK